MENMEDKLWKLAQKKAKKNYEMEYGSWEEADKYEREDWVFYEYNKLKEDILWILKKFLINVTILSCSKRRPRPK